MNPDQSQGQRGFSLLGVIFIALLLALLGVLVVQSVPPVLEYLAIKKAVAKAGEETTVVSIRDRFDRLSQVDNINSISGKDLEIYRTDNKVVVAFEYEREIHLAGPVWLLFKFHGSSR